MKLNDPISFAKEFAALCHADFGQSYGDKPYSAHLDAVVGVLLRFEETDKTMLAAGYLHDVVEDVGVSYSTIADLFGDKVCALVRAVTDEPGENRKERKAKTYPKIKATAGATELKLADRIANIENSISTGNSRTFLMYKKEHKDFEANLRPQSTEIEEQMWKHIDYLFVAGLNKLPMHKIYE